MTDRTEQEEAQVHEGMSTENVADESEIQRKHLIVAYTSKSCIKC